MNIIYYIDIDSRNFPPDNFLSCILGFIPKRFSLHYNFIRYFTILSRRHSQIDLCMYIVYIYDLHVGSFILCCLLLTLSSSAPLLAVLVLGIHMSHRYHRCYIGKRLELTFRSTPHLLPSHSEFEWQKLEFGNDQKLISLNVKLYFSVYIATNKWCCCYRCAYLSVTSRPHFLFRSIEFGTQTQMSWRKLFNADATRHMRCAFFISFQSCYSKFFHTTTIRKECFVFHNV